MMKAHLLCPDRDVDPSQPLPAAVEEITRDLALDRLFDAMSGGDEFVALVARQVLLSSLSDIPTILYR